MIQSTNHKPYASYENGDVLPILAYKEDDHSPTVQPMVPDEEGGLIEASVYGEYDITVNKPDQRQLLHG